MTLPSKWAEKRERPKFRDRLGLAQPVLAAGTLTFFSLILGLPLLYLLNSAFPPDISPAGVMAQFNLGSVYNDVASWMTGPLSALISDQGGMTFAGVFVSAFGFSLFAWAIAMMLVSQWRAQVPVMEEVEPYRFLIAVVLSLVLIVMTFWMTRLAGEGSANAQGLALGILHLAVGALMLLAWYFALTGTFISWRSLLITAFVTSFALTVFVWILGALVPQEPGNFTQALFVLAHLFGVWLLVVLGVHFLARQTLEQSDWQDLDTLTRGQQVDFGLAIMKTLGHADNKNRWMSGHAIAERLGAKHAMAVQALRRLNDFDLVRASQASNRPDHWRLSTESLHAINLQDLMEAFGATLDPSNGVYEEGPQQALIDLADQEKRVFRTDLASLTRGDRGPALTSDAPAFLSLITDRGVGTETDAAGAPPPVTDQPKAYERLTALFEKEAEAEDAPSSQVSEDFPAFVLPSSKGAMTRTQAAAKELEAEEPKPEEDLPEEPVAELVTEEASDEADIKADADEDSPKEDPKPMVSTGLTSLVGEASEDLTSYTMALVSRPKGTKKA